MLILPSWEYKILPLMGNNQEESNSLGAEGWELVAVTPHSEDSYATAYLKRKLQSDKWRL